jgi:hypothetical protein
VTEIQSPTRQKYSAKNDRNTVQNTTETQCSISQKYRAENDRNSVRNTAESLIKGGGGPQPVIFEYRKGFDGKGVGLDFCLVYSAGQAARIIGT